jgi:pilus assembly protein FimV
VAKKTYQTLKYLRLRTSALAVASCLALTGLPLAVQAAGLGKVTVFSALGQPLRAEVELSATRDELSGMKAQLASPDAFKQAGLDYAATLMGIKFSIDKRANGQSIIRLSSDKPINDPFVDMLLELNWPAGRLVREYTFLLDPPEVAAKAAAAVAPIAPVVAKPVPAAKPVVEMRAESPIDEKLLAKPEPKKPRVQEQTKQATEGGDTHEVKRGDSLNKIANAIKPEGVSLDQMLVGLFRANQEAFDGGNMNRLKAGKILWAKQRKLLSPSPPIGTHIGASWQASLHRRPSPKMPASSKLPARLPPKLKTRQRRSPNLKIKSRFPRRKVLLVRLLSQASVVKKI